MAVASLFRRNYHQPQSMKLQKWNKNKMTPISSKMTLQEYASLEIDKFYFESHFFNWYGKYLTGLPVLFVRYEKIFDNIKQILEFSGIPQININEFPKKKQRESVIEEIPTETLKKLDRIYGCFATKLEKLDDIEIRQNGKYKIFSRKYINLQYGKALTTHTATGLKSFLRKHPRVFTMLRKIKQLTNHST